MRKKKSIFIFLIASILSPANAELKKVGLPTGQWYLYRELDSMTDKMTCIAYYEDGTDIQLTTTSFSVSYDGRGGVSSYIIRLDDTPPMEMALANRIEQQISAIVIKSDNPVYGKIITAKRLRMRTNTLVRGVVDEDINVADVPRMLSRLSGPECQPVQN